MSTEQDDQDSSRELDQLGDRIEELFQQVQLRSAMRLTRELIRQARSRQVVVPYMRGLFDQMRLGHGLLEPRTTADAAVELIAILNDEEHARQIEPLLDEGHYQWVCQWMTSCAYDNLAEATGNMQGFNSPGMHECITDGIQICRQTGKTECIKCFREYATSVYLAADDLEMVRHQVQSLLEYRGQGADQKDRRWSGTRQLARLALLNGQLESARELFEKALELTQAEDVYLKLKSRLQVLVELDEVRLLLGESPTDWHQLPPVTVPDRDEWPELALDRDSAAALQLVLRGEHQAAIEKLTEWDQRLNQQACLVDWFEVRLRLIAAYLLAGKRNRGESLARGLEARAAEAQDFLTLRRLKRLLDPDSTPCPIPLLGEIQLGVTQHPAASHMAAVTPAVPTAPLQLNEEAEHNGVEGAADAAGEPSPAEIATPLKAEIESLMERILTARQGETENQLEEELQRLFSELISHTPDKIEHPRDAATLLHISRWVITGPHAARQIWEYGQALIQRFPQDATVLNVCADLGAHFLQVDADEFSDVAPELLDRMFQKSLTLNTDLPRNFLRAGEYFEQRGNLGEAERCYSRAFRLDRVEGTAAIALANLYRQTDRPRDALAVLDLSLREGSENADVAWEAGLAAYGLDQFDSQLTFLNRHLELAGPHLWVEYYRAWALLELKRYEECLTALAAEEAQEPAGVLHLRILAACARIGLGQREAACELIQEILQLPLAEIDYLSMAGISRNFGRLGQAVADWPATDPVRQAVMERLLATGLMPDFYFELQREHTPESEDISFYRIRLRQPTGSDWANQPQCLPGEQHWTEYLIDWGVLAKDETEAVNRVLDMHYSGLAEPAEVVEIEQGGDDYTDRPGVVWQGQRWSPEQPAEAEESAETGEQEWDSPEE
jgi:tetratricopeptide (TPR) repeat protein